MVTHGDLDIEGSSPYKAQFHTNGEGNNLNSEEERVKKARDSCNYQETKMLWLANASRSSFDKHPPNKKRIGSEKYL